MGSKDSLIPYKRNFLCKIEFLDISPFCIELRLIDVSTTHRYDKIMQSRDTTLHTHTANSYEKCPGYFMHFFLYNQYIYTCVGANQDINREEPI